MIGQYQKVNIKSTTINLQKFACYMRSSCGFSQLLFLQNYPCTNIFLWWRFFIFFQFALLFRKINVYVQNIIHHALKAEVIQEMIAGKIRSLPQRHTHTHTHKLYTNTCVWTHHNPGTSSHSLPWLCQVHRGENSQGFCEGDSHGQSQIPNFL